MPEYKRVRINKTGAKVTVARVGEGMTEINEPAVDVRGIPLVATYPDTSAAPAKKTTPKPAAKKAAAKRPASKKTAAKKTASNTSAAPSASTPEGEKS